MTDSSEFIGRPALIIVDMQNDFVRQGAPMLVPEAVQISEKIACLADAFRKSSVPVIYLKWVTEPEDKFLRFKGRWGWVDLLQEPVMACRRGHKRYYPDVSQVLDCSDIVYELAPLEGDITVEKHGFGGFSETDLHATLSALAIDIIYVTGVMAESCVEDTCREGFSHLYQVVLVTDAIGSARPIEKQRAIDTISSRYGWGTTTENAIASIRKSAQRSSPAGNA